MKPRHCGCCIKGEVCLYKGAIWDAVVKFVHGLCSFPTDSKEFREMYFTIVTKIATACDEFVLDESWVSK